MELGALVSLVMEEEKKPFTGCVEISSIASLKTLRSAVQID